MILCKNKAKYVHIKQKNATSYELLFVANCVNRKKLGPQNDYNGGDIPIALS